MKSVEVGAAVLIEGDDLAVDDDAAPHQLCGEGGGHLWEAIGEVVARPGLQQHLPVMQSGDAAGPVVLDLRHPALTGGRQARGGQHRPGGQGGGGTQHIRCTWDFGVGRYWSDGDLHD